MVSAIDGLKVSGFRFEIVALSTDAHLEPADLLGTAARLDLLTDQGLQSMRAFHGYVTAFEPLGSNGGFARYRLVVEPWTALLRMRRDAYVFQDMSVVEIIDEVFGDYAGQGALLLLWRWQLADAAAYPPRSLCIQHGESDHDFVQRLLAEEGLFAWFQHVGGAEGVEGDVGGQHVLVIADRNEAFGSAASGRSGAALGPIRFHRASAMEVSDTGSTAQLVPSAAARDNGYRSAPVPPQRQAVNPARPGREQRQRCRWVPGCRWRGPPLFSVLSRPSVTSLRRLHPRHHRRSSRARVVLMAVVGVVSSLSSVAEASGCGKPRNAFDSVYSEANEFSQVDRELNAKFGDLKKALKPEQQSSLKTGQVAWIKSRDSACSLTKDGDFYVDLDCAVTKTNERLEFLKERERECLSTDCVDAKIGG